MISFLLDVSLNLIPVPVPAIVILPCNSRALPKGADISEVSLLCWGGKCLLSGRAHLSSLSRFGECTLGLPIKHGLSPVQRSCRLGFFPLAVRLHSHRITICLMFLKPFVWTSNTYCARSKFWPWLSRPQNPFNLAPGSEAPRTHNKEGRRKAPTVQWSLILCQSLH